LAVGKAGITDDSTSVRGVHAFIRAYGVGRRAAAHESMGIDTIRLVTMRSGYDGLRRAQEGGIVGDDRRPDIRFEVLEATPCGARQAISMLEARDASFDAGAEVAQLRVAAWPVALLMALPSRCCRRASSSSRLRKKAS
jgi:hypothetical protein